MDLGDKKKGVIEIEREEDRGIYTQRKRDLERGTYIQRERERENEREKVRVCGEH